MLKWNYHHHDVVYFQVFDLLIKLTFDCFRLFDRSVISKLSRNRIERLARDISKGEIQIEKG